MVYRLKYNTVSESHNNGLENFDQIFLDRKNIEINPLLEVYSKYIEKIDSALNKELEFLKRLRLRLTLEKSR